MHDATAGFLFGMPGTRRGENDETLRKTRILGGFTLIELLIVIIIIGILAAIAIPMFLGQRDKAKESAVKGGVHNIELGIASYAVDNGDNYPADGTVSKSVAGRCGGAWPTSTTGRRTPGRRSTWSRAPTRGQLRVHADRLTTFSSSATGKGGTPSYGSVRQEAAQ